MEWSSSSGLVNGFYVAPHSGFKTVSSIYSRTRKTVLDLGSSFKNLTHYIEMDVTVARMNCTGNHGGGGPVIFLPGLDMSGLSIYPNAIKASENRDVIVLLAGYSRNQTTKELSDLVVQYIVDSNMKDIVLVGESFGGVLAVDSVIQIRERVSQMILINPATSFPRTRWMKRISRVRSSNSHAFTARILAHGPRIENIMESMYDMSGSYPDHLYNYILTYVMMAFNILVTDPSLVIERIRCYLGMSTKQMDAMCRVVRTPTTIIVGRDDRLLPSSREADRLSKLIPGSTVIKLDKVGHMVTPDVFDIRDFI